MFIRFKRGPKLKLPDLLAAVNASDIVTTWDSLTALEESMSKVTSQAS